MIIWVVSDGELSVPCVLACNGSDSGYFFHLLIGERVLVCVCGSV